MNKRRVLLDVWVGLVVAAAQLILWAAVFQNRGPAVAAALLAIAALAVSLVRSRIPAANGAEVTA